MQARFAYLKLAPIETIHQADKKRHERRPDRAESNEKALFINNK
jgi:hypothetical protein